MDLQAKAEKNNHLSGVYVHVPFCASTCDFCAFYQQKPRREDLESYLKGLKRDFELRLPEGPVETVFMGGGTPGLLPARDFEFIGRELLKRIERPIEWTVEMAPSTVKKEKLLVMKEMGVTRISMGVQSFSEARLKSLGRLHSPKQIYKAYDCICEVGFKSVNLDMMFAIPGQDVKAWEEDLLEVMRLGPEHISTYCLTFEEDTVLYVKLSQGKVSIDEARECEMYLKTWELLGAHGYEQYEISNFSRPGHECLHNVNTWKMKPWLGFGPSAASQYGMERYSNPFSQKEWLEGMETGVPKRVEEVKLSREGLGEDALIFGLRMNRGVDLNEWKSVYGEEQFEKYRAMFDRLIEEGLCECLEDSLRLTNQGRLLADSVAQAIIGFSS